VSRRCANRYILTLLAASMLAACAMTAPLPSRSPESRADELLASNVYQALNADPIYFYRHVDVRVNDGIANLSGYVWSVDAIYRARKIARDVPGVRRVVTSHLELEREGRGPGGPAR
jgi:osmotically-inducible protein OsmY